MIITSCELNKFLALPGSQGSRLSPVGFFSCLINEMRRTNAFCRIMHLHSNTSSTLSWGHICGFNVWWRV